MPKHCAAYGCHNHNMMAEKFSFHRFPKDHERRSRWIAAMKRDNWQPTTTTEICNKHFITGKPNSDKDHPDYVPSVFIFSRTPKESLEKKVLRFDSAQKRRKSLQDLESARPKCVKKLKKEECRTVAVERGSDPGSSPPSVSPSGVHQERSGGAQDTSTAPSDQQQQQAPPHQVKSSSREDRTSRHRDMEQEVIMEMAALRAERDSLQKQLDSTKFSHKLILNNDKKSKFYVGLSWSVFWATFSFLSSFVNPNNQRYVLPPVDQFFISLVKLRLDLQFQFIANISGIGKSTAIDIFWRWIHLMHAKLSFLVRWPDTAAVKATLPAAFKMHFPRLTALVDCFEIFIESPKNLLARAQTFSNYKKHTTVKVFIACTPLGAVSFLSSAWGGRASDVEIVRDSGFITANFHDNGDQILADRGFTLVDDFALVNVELLLPSFTKGKKQLSAREVETSRIISSIRIHIERIIGLMKNRYTILQGRLPIQVVKSIKSEAHDINPSSIDKILESCAALTNLGDGIVK